MATRPAHPDKQLFDYLNDALEEPSARRVEQHLSGCSECARTAQLFRALKSTRPVLTAGVQPHPDASEIAALFYGKASIPRPLTAAHVATCRSCAEELSEYARAEAAASLHDPAGRASGEVPAASWEMIREWEESSFAQPRPATEAISQELLAKLFNLVGEGRNWLRDARRTTANPPAGTTHTDAVTVIVVDRSGEVRGVEIFLKETDASGANVLRHAENSERFDNNAVHVLQDAEGVQRVASYRVQCDTIRFEDASSAEEGTDFFIIEE